MFYISGMVQSIGTRIRKVYLFKRRNWESNVQKTFKCCNVDDIISHEGQQILRQRQQRGKAAAEIFFEFIYPSQAKWMIEQSKQMNIVEWKGKKFNAEKILPAQLFIIQIFCWLYKNQNKCRNLNSWRRYLS